MGAIQVTSTYSIILARSMQLTGLWYPFKLGHTGSQYTRVPFYVNHHHRERQIRIDKHGKAHQNSDGAVACGGGKVPREYCSV